MKKQHLLSILAVCGLTALSLSNITPVLGPEIKRTLLQQHDLSIAGLEAVQVLIDFGPGTIFADHWHPGEEVIYVLKGSFEYKVGNQQPVVVNAGSVLFIPAGAMHSAKNIGIENALELATYVVKKGEPLVVMKTNHQGKSD